MDIYVVQPGDDIESIANKFGVASEKIILDNEIEKPENLVVGQVLVITYPEQTYTVSEGDTLSGIAEKFNISIVELLQNNPTVIDSEALIPGDTIVIRYRTAGNITTNGYAYPYIKNETLRKTLPDLTYLTVFNYRTLNNGDIAIYYDDSEIIQTAKDYGVAPLMMTTTFTPHGKPNVETAYNILLNEQYQDNLINQILNIIKSKGYYGVNMTFNFMNGTNQKLYEAVIIKVAARIHQEGFLYFATINPNISIINNQISFEKVDYSKIGKAVDGLAFLQFIWGNNTGAPGPVTNYSSMKMFMDYVLTMVSPDKLLIGDPILSIDWELPYQHGRSSVYTLTLDAALDLAHDTGVAIQFDETSQTPYFIYNRINFGAPAQHIVWTIDARSLNSLNQIVRSDRLSGIIIWNIMVYCPQLWLIINSQYDINKVIKENTDTLSKMYLNNP